MPLDHALEVVRSIFIGRLDDLCGEWLEDDGRRYHLTTTQWLELFQSLQLALFPEEFGECEPYTPAASERVREREVMTWKWVKVVGDDGAVVSKRMAEMVTVAVKAPSGGLVKRIPLTAVYAKYLEAGRRSPVANLTMQTTNKHGDTVTVPVLADADLAELGRRAERREGARAMGV